MVKGLFGESVQLVISLRETNNSGFLIGWDFVNGVKTFLPYSTGFVEFLSRRMLGGSDTVW